jgi:hypothetical protein
VSNRVKALILASGISIAAWLLAPSMAQAACCYIQKTSTEGNDYSYNSWIVNNWQMTTCDMESDSRHVYAEYRLESGEWSEVSDGNGANNSCGTRGPYTGITEHRTCEAIDFLPDNCGNREITTV